MQTEDVQYGILNRNAKSDTVSSRGKYQRICLIKGEGLGGSHKYSSTYSSLEREIVWKWVLPRMRCPKKIKYIPCRWVRTSQAYNWSQIKRRTYHHPSPHPPLPPTHPPSVLLLSGIGVFFAVVRLALSCSEPRVPSFPIRQGYKARAS